MANRGYGNGYGYGYGGYNDSGYGSNASSYGTGGDPVAYTKGACSSNGQPNARAGMLKCVFLMIDCLFYFFSIGVGVYYGDGHYDNVSAPLSGGRQTNNRAEIRAAETAVKQARANGQDSVTIGTNSDYLYNSTTKWMGNWQSNGWKTSKGGDVKNREDFTRLNEASKGMNVQYERTAGQRNNYGNQQASGLARKGAHKY